MVVVNIKEKSVHVLFFVNTHFLTFPTTSVLNK